MARARKKPLDPAINRVPLGELTIFDVTEDELDALERGSPESIFMNLAIAATSIAVSFTVALVTTKVESVKTFCILVVVTVVGYFAGLTLGLLWWQSRRSCVSVAQKIRSRVAPEGIQEGSGTESSP